MIFGEAVESAASVSPAAWISEERPGAWGTVGSLVPDRYPSIVRVIAPEPGGDRWWPAYRDLFHTVAQIGARHTTTPGEAWFAVWEGHGFDTATTTYAWRDLPPNEATRREREAERDRVRAESEQRNVAIRSALSEVPRFELPHRAYYLLRGPVAAATEIRDPSSLRASEGWQRPDLFWPDDRRWFVATDVDVWSLYVGGDPAFVAELRATVPTPTEAVTPADRLVVED